MIRINLFGVDYEEKKRCYMNNPLSLILINEYKEKITLLQNIPNVLLVSEMLREENHIEFFVHHIDCYDF